MSTHACNKYCSIGKGHEIQRMLDIDFSTQEGKEFALDLAEWIFELFK